MPVQDAFHAVLIMNLGRLPSWVVLRGFDPCPYFSLTGCNGRCHTTPKFRFWDAAKWGHAVRVTDVGATPQKP
jgi:hypothetical protein